MHFTNGTGRSDLLFIFLTSQQHFTGKTAGSRLHATVRGTQAPGGVSVSAL